jgi:hypothetical protein
MFTIEGHPVPFFLIKLSHNVCLYLNVNLKYTPDSAHITQEDKCCATLFLFSDFKLTTRGINVR